MPLVASTLKSGIQGQLEPLILAHTQKAFFDAMEKFRDVAAQQTGNTGIDSFSNANAQASQVFSNLMKKLAEDIAITVSTNVDIFVKSGTVNVLVNGVTVGGPAPHAIVSQPGVGSVL